MSKNIHIVFPKDFVQLVADAMTKLNYNILDMDSSIELFSHWASSEDNKDIKVDAVLVGDPLESFDDTEEAMQEYIKHIYEIRRNRPDLRLILILPSQFRSLESYTLKFTQLGIFDIHYAVDFTPVDLANWIEEPKSFTDWNELIINHVPTSAGTSQKPPHSQSKQQVESEVQKTTTVKKNESKEDHSPMQEEPKEKKPKGGLPHLPLLKKKEKKEEQVTAEVKEPIPSKPVNNEKQTETKEVEGTEKTAPANLPKEPEKEKQTSSIKRMIENVSKGITATAPVKQESAVDEKPIKKQTVPVKHISNTQENEPIVIEPKTIAFVNVSRGAGSTFHSVNFARWLTSKGFQTALYENPVDYAGRTYAWDFIGLNEVDNSSLPHLIHQKLPVDLSGFQSKGRTDFYVADTSCEKIESFDPDTFLRYIHTGKQPFKIVDMGHIPFEKYEEKEVEEILSIFDHVVCLVDVTPHIIMPNIGRLTFYLKQTESMNLLKEGKGFEKYLFAINRYHKSIPKAELKAIEMHQAFRFPVIDQGLIYDCLYNGKTPMENEEIEDILSPYYSDLAGELDLKIPQPESGKRRQATILGKLALF